MKTVFCRIIILATCIGSFSALGATVPSHNTSAVLSPNPTAALQSTRTGVLDMRQVMEKSTQIAQIREKLQKDFKPKQEKLLAAQSNLKNAKDRLLRDNTIMSNNDRTQLEQKITTEEKDLQQMQTNFQREIITEQNKMLKDFLDNVRMIVENVAKKDNLGLVITKDTVAYVKPDLDITSKIIQQLPHK
jgi:outer membrane protein